MDVEALLHFGEAFPVVAFLLTEVISMGTVHFFMCYGGWVAFAFERMKNWTDAFFASMTCSNLSIYDLSGFIPGEIVRKSKHLISTQLRQ